MKKNWNNKKYASFIRESWATYKNLKFENSQKSLENYLTNHLWF